MPICFHIQNGHDLDKTGNPWPNVGRRYNAAPSAGDGSPEGLSGKITRLYIGDEFCTHRLPDLPRLEQLWAFSREQGMPLTLLTPFVSDAGIDQCAPLFDYLATREPDTEIVVNDWGMLFFLKQHFPTFPIALGRLLNKGFKDPRISPDRLSREATDPMLTAATFDFPDFHQQALALGATRLERDLLPYADATLPDSVDMATTVYFPFGFVTTGRVCRLSALTGRKTARFAINSECSRVCEQIFLKMKNPEFPFPLIQSGNTIFYRYPPDRCQAILHEANTNGLRLVYQDMMKEHWV